MKLTLARSLWGVTLPKDQSFPRFKEEGFEAIETPLPPAADEAGFRELLDRHGFGYVPMIFTTGTTVADHVESFRRDLTRAMAFKPIHVTAHSGRDAFTASQAASFFADAIRIEQDLGATVAHETHRGRILFHPWAARELLPQFPALKLCCDYSHWVCVAERLLDDESILQLCADRCQHIHARVGYAEGPQVPDPTAPEYRNEVEAHERWWDMIWESQQRRGMQTSTLTPEFGPPAYLHTLPHTNVPVADLWSICRWQAHRQKGRFARRGK